jgi:hypothetical protein
MDSKKGLVGWALVVVAIVAAAFLGVRFPIPEPPPDDVFMEAMRPVQFRSVNVQQDLTVGGGAAVAGDAAVTGDVTITGGLSVTGGVTGTNVLTTGNQTIAGIKTFSTPAAFTGGVTGPMLITGPTAAATATPALRFNNTGAGNVSLQIEKNATPVASFSNAGGLTAAFLTTAGALTSDSAVVGGGYGATGCTLSNAGVLQCNGAATIDGALDVGGTLNYGANNLYPVGFASSGQQVVYGTSTITTTLAVPHGLTTVTFCQATLGEDPETGAGDAAAVTVAVAANVCTVKAWQDDFSAATETNVVVHWMVIGAP